MTTRYRDTIFIHGNSPRVLGRHLYMSPANYEVEVLDLLRLIENKTKSGKTLLDGLNRLRGKVCRIIPVPYDAPGQTMATPYSDVRCLIEYNPWTWKARDMVLGIDPTNRGSSADDVLFHELVHAFLQLAQIFRSVPRMDGYHNREDFYAVLFTNIYVSEQNKSLSPNHTKHLRGDHNLPFHTLDEGEPDVARAGDPSLQFYKKYTFEIDDLFHSDSVAMTHLAEKLATVPAAFNPLRSRPKSEYIPMENPFGGWTPK